MAASRSTFGSRGTAACGPCVTSAQIPNESATTTDRHAATATMGAPALRVKTAISAKQNAAATIRRLGRRGGTTASYSSPRSSEQGSSISGSKEGTKKGRLMGHRKDICAVNIDS